MNNYDMDLSQSLKPLYNQYQSLLDISPSQKHSDISKGYTIMGVWLSVHMTFRKENEKDIITVKVNAEFADSLTRQKVSDYLQGEEFAFTRIMVYPNIIR